MKHSLVLLLIIILPIFINNKGSRLYAQKHGQALIDSIVQQLPGAKEDTNKVRMLGIVSFRYYTINPDAGIKYGLTGLELAEKLKWKRGLASIYQGLAVNYERKSNYPVALDYFFKCLKVAEDIGNKRIMAVAFIGAGTIYDSQEEYTKALDYFSKAEKISEEIKDEGLINKITATIGIIYVHQKNYDPALAYLLKSVKICEETGDNEILSADYTNIGLIYNIKDDYSEALAYFQKALQLAEKSGNEVNIASVLVNIGSVYHDQGKNKEAIDCFSKGIAIFRKLGDLNSLQQVTQGISDAQEQLGDYKQALENYKQYVTIKDSVFNIENNVKIANLETKRQLDVKEKQIQIDRLDLAKKRNERWFFLAGILLLTVIGILFINRQRLREKKLEAEKKNAESELKIAETQLNGFRQSMKEKNSLIEQFTSEIERMKEGMVAETDTDTLTQLQNAIILTDEQWEHFRGLFEKVHRGFFVNLKKKIPDLSQAEIRFLTLTKLKLTSKEMASMLGISQNAIRIYRHRLRRKLELDKEDMIEELVESI